MRLIFLFYFCLSAISSFGSVVKTVSSNHIVIDNLECIPNVSVLESFTDNKTLYFIQKEYDLQGHNLDMPDSCVIIFNGGQIKNGTIEFNHTTIISNGEELDSCIKCNYHGDFYFSNRIENLKLYRGNTGGYKDNGVTLSVITNSPDNDPKSAACGFINGNHASKYPGRDAVSMYVENNNYTPIIVEDAKFSLNSIILPRSFNIKRLEVGDYVDVFSTGFVLESDNKNSRWTSIVDSIDYDKNTVYVKFGGFYRVVKGGSNSPETPTAGSKVYFKLATKIWSINSQVITRGGIDSRVRSMCGYELDVNNNIANCYSEGMTIASTGLVPGNLAYTMDGPWDVGFFARNPVMSFYSRDYDDGRNKYVLRHDKMVNNKNEIVGYIDPSFAIHQNQSVIDLGSDEPYISTTYGSLKFSNNGEVKLGIGKYGYNFSVDNFTPFYHKISDIGSMYKRFRNLYIDGSMYLGNNVVSVKYGRLYVNRNNSVENRSSEVAIVNSGVYADRPKEEVSIGTSYFCTDKRCKESEINGIMIYYLGNEKWVDALGRLVK